MIKKIQNYLLTHHPIIWNVKLIPMLLILLSIHIIFFIIGFVSSDVSFEEIYYYYSPFSSMELLYTVSVLVGIIGLIGWLVFYNRNNGFKIFYPRKTGQIYLEWSLLLVITIGLALIPFTITEGYSSRWKSIASKTETKKAIEILERAEVLIPNTENSCFEYNDSYDTPIPVPEGMNLRPDSINFDNYSIQYSGTGSIIIRGYTGQSLLFFTSYDYYNYHKNKDKEVRYIDSTTWAKNRRQDEVKEWLRKGDKDKIMAVMKDFENLQKSHNLPINITPEEWMKRIYNPPFFPVNKQTIIRNYQPTSFYNSSDYYYSEEEIVVEAVSEVDSDHFVTSTNKPIPFLQYKELETGYNQILRCHEDDTDIHILFLLCLCIALWTSLFIFSFRVTNGKSWLISLVGTGVLLFAVFLGTITILDSLDWNRTDERIFVMLVLFFWIALFLGLGIRIISKVRSRKQKRYSKHYINLFIWLIPCQIPLLFFIAVLYMEVSNKQFDISENMVMNMFWLNILFTILAMWPISILVKKWKAIPEE